MSNEIFDRLERLMKSLMLSVESGSYTRAEMKAYAAGMELAAQRLENVLADIFADTASDSGLSMFLSLIGEKHADSPEESRQLITQAFSAKKRMLKKSEYHKILDSFGQADCGTLTNELRVNFSNKLNRQVLETLSLLRNKYLPAFVHLSPRGKNGQYFSVWEGMGLRWFELDELNIEWHTLDAL